MMIRIAIALTLEAAAIGLFVFVSQFLAHLVAGAA